MSSGGDIPRWLRDEITRTTPKARRDPAVKELAAGIDTFSTERYGAARQHLLKAKRLAPQVGTIRELLGLAAYHTQAWEEALRELRTFRRISGDGAHVPVEMDCLRALKRYGDVDKTWQIFRRLDVGRSVELEGRVVYASHLLDRDRVADAWRVIKPGRLVADPSDAELRSWYVAARVAIAAGEPETAERLVNAIERATDAFPGLEELRSELDV